MSNVIVVLGCWPLVDGDRVVTVSPWIDWLVEICNLSWNCLYWLKGLSHGKVEAPTLCPFVFQWLSQRSKMFSLRHRTRFGQPLTWIRVWVNSILIQDWNWNDSNKKACSLPGQVLATLGVMLSLYLSNSVPVLQVIKTTCTWTCSAPSPETSPPDSSAQPRSPGNRWDSMWGYVCVPPPRYWGSYLLALSSWLGSGCWLVECLVNVMTNYFKKLLVLVRYCCQGEAVYLHETSETLPQNKPEFLNGFLSKHIVPTNPNVSLTMWKTGKPISSAEPSRRKLLLDTDASVSFSLSTGSSWRPR